MKIDELDERAMSQLASFDSKTGVEILDQFEKGLDADKIRNKSAYMSGVMTRFKRYGGGSRLPHDVQHRLDALVSSGMIKAGDIDTRCIEALSLLPLTLAIKAVERFGTRKLSDVRNVSAFFMSTLRTVEKEGPDQSYPSMVQHAYAPSPLAAPPAFPSLGPGDMAFSQLGGMGPPQGYLPQSQLTSGVVMPVLTPMTPSPTAFHPIPPPLQGKKFYGLEQQRMGVRVEEFRSLSIYASYVRPAAALKLQELWDEGIRLAGVFDERAWEILAELGAPEALAVIEDVAQQMQQPNRLRSVNAYFTSVARKYLDKGKPTTTFSRPSGASSSSASSHKSNPGYGQLNGALKHKVDDLIKEHGKYLSRSHFDEGVVDALTKLKEHEALEVLDELAENQLSNVRNIPAYIMGICKRFHQGKSKRDK